MSLANIAKEHQKHIEGSIHGVGRLSIMVQINGKSYYPPKLHFLLYTDTGPNGSPCLSAYCIEFGLQYGHEKQETAIQGLLDLCQKQFQLLLMAYLDKKSPKEVDYDKVITQLEAENQEGYWSIYRRVNFKNSLKGVKTADQPELFYRLAQKSSERIYQAYQDMYEFNIQLYEENKKLKNQVELKENVNLRARNLSEIGSPPGTFELLPAG